MPNTNDDFWMVNATKLKAAVMQKGGDFLASATGEDLRSAAGAEFEHCSEETFTSLVAVMRCHLQPRAGAQA